MRYRDRGPRQLPITYWVPRRDQSTLPELRRTPKMIKWLQKRLGPYPFDRIGVVIVPNFSAMETQTLVTMGGRLLSGYGHRAFRSDLLHEYAHQWYGDTVTPDNWKDLWLNESFAMYTQFRWEVSRGWETMGQVRRYLRETDNESRASDGPPGAYHRQQFASGCVYYCGALMIDRLRAEVGVTKFNDLWRALAAEAPQRQRQPVDLHHLGQRPVRREPRSVPDRLAHLPDDAQRLIGPAAVRPVNGRTGLSVAAHTMVVDVRLG